MRLCVAEAVCFEDGSNQFGLSFQNLIEEFLVIDVVPPTLRLSLHWTILDLRFVDRLNCLDLIDPTGLCSIDVLVQSIC